MMNDKKNEIIQKYKNGASQKELSLEYNVSNQWISKVLAEHKVFESYIKNIEDFKRKNIINEETELYDLSKLLKHNIRCLNALVNRNIRSLDDLLLLTEDDIYRIKGLGKKSQKHINSCIKEYTQSIINT